jgi:hypothetical protein
VFGHSPWIGLDWIGLDWIGLDWIGSSGVHECVVPDEQGCAVRRRRGRGAVLGGKWRWFCGGTVVAVGAGGQFYKGTYRDAEELEQIVELAVDVAHHRHWRRHRVHVLLFRQDLVAEWGVVVHRVEWSGVVGLTQETWDSGGRGARGAPL